jgi:uncharacterized protein YwqG
MAKKEYTNEELMELVEIEPELVVPRAFALHWNEIRQPKKPFISIEATQITKPVIGRSGFLVPPMLPVDFPYPLDWIKHPLYPLAQISLRDMPPLEGLPESGYLQFYISGADGMFGLDTENPLSQAGSRVLYFTEAEVKRHQTDFSFLVYSQRDDLSPIWHPHEIQFTRREEYPGGESIESGMFIEEWMKPIARQYSGIEHDLLSEIPFCFSNYGHKMGGYPNFCQSDPRQPGQPEPLKEYILLFQMDGDKEIMWGDAGVGNFFIHPDDLAKKDFSKVLYNCDCA